MQLIFNNYTSSLQMSDEPKKFCQKPADSVVKRPKATLFPL